MTSRSTMARLTEKRQCHAVLTIGRRCPHPTWWPNYFCHGHENHHDPRRDRRLVLTHEEAAKVHWWFTVLGGSEAFADLEKSPTNAQVTVWGF